MKKLAGKYIFDVYIINIQLQNCHINDCYIICDKSRIDIYSVSFSLSIMLQMHIISKIGLGELQLEII